MFLTPECLFVLLQIEYVYILNVATFCAALLEK
jgi:hypothetical protein